MAETYNCFDLNVSTTQGEGFGLTTLESMACGVPQILPDWSALGDWAKGAALMVPCPTTHIGPPYVNVIGGVPDEAKFIDALDLMYRNPSTRAEHALAALGRAAEPRFAWPAVGAAYLDILNSLLGPPRNAERPAAATTPSPGFRKAYKPDSKPAQQEVG